MESRMIGSLSVSTVGLGCNNFGGRTDAAASAAVVHAALDAGITFFDTADIYGGTLSEEHLGLALKQRRDEAIVATKFGVPIDDDRKGGGSASYVRSAAEDSLRRLGTDRIDLYQIHFPDQATPIDETLAALDELVRAGKVREIGCSNFSPDMLDEAEAASRKHGIARFVSVQNEYSLLRRAPEHGVLEACERHRIAFIPYFPLASGLLTGKYRRNEPPPEGTRLAGMPADRQAEAFSDKNVNRVEALEAFAAARDHTLLELAFSWLLARGTVASVIAGATKPDQARANAAAAGWSLSEAELFEIDDLLAKAKAP
jgi:aryl-alcohol dehydrogenase-like predicted oxidoreductase